MMENPGDNKVMGLPPQTLPYTVERYDTVLIDMSHLLNRVLRASKGGDGGPPLLELKTSAGQPTGGLFGVIKSIRSVLARPDFIIGDAVAIWDGRPRGVSPRRAQLFPKYKVWDPEPGAVPDPDEIQFRSIYEGQRPLIDSVLTMLGVPVVNLPYREGDDVLANLALRIPGRVLILSDDSDFYQLVDQRIHIYRPVQDQYVTAENFVRAAKTQTPANHLMIKAICGDSSDAITGIPGVGGTTAERVANAWVSPEWRSERFDREGIVAAATALISSDSRNKSRYSKLIANIDIVERNYHLVNLLYEKLTDEELQTASNIYRLARGFDEVQVGRALANYEFNSIVDKFISWVAPFRTLSQARQK